MIEEIYEVYAEENDMTFIIRDTFECENLLSTEVIGFYFGEPDGDKTPYYIGNLKSTF